VTKKQKTATATATLNSSLMHCALAVSVTTLETSRTSNVMARNSKRDRGVAVLQVSATWETSRPRCSRTTNSTTPSPIFFYLRRGAVRVCPSLITASRTLPSATPPGNAIAVRQAQLHSPRRFSCPGMLDTGQTLQHHDEYQDDAR
jgi:hypothetical protein